MPTLTLTLSDRMIAAIDARAGSVDDTERADWIRKALRSELRAELETSKQTLADAIQSLPKADRDALAAKIGMPVPSKVVE